MTYGFDGPPRGLEHGPILGWCETWVSSNYWGYFRVSLGLGKVVRTHNGLKLDEVGS